MKEVREKFVFTGADYQQFRGYVFFRGIPVTVKDRATAEILKGMAGFQHVAEEKHEPKEEVQAPTPVLSARPKLGLPSRFGRAK